MTTLHTETTAPALTPVQWLICAIAAIGFAFDSYELLMLPLIVRPALADLLGGYTQFAPYTLVIKGLEGLLVGLVAWRLTRGPTATAGGVAAAVLAILIGGAVMVGGYFVAEAFIMGLGTSAAGAEVPGNIFQVAGGLVVAIPAALLLRGLVPSRRAP